MLTAADCIKCVFVKAVGDKNSLEGEQKFARVFFTCPNVMDLQGVGLWAQALSKFHGKNYKI